MKRYFIIFVNLLIILHLTTKVDCFSKEVNNRNDNISKNRNELLSVGSAIINITNYDYGDVPIKSSAKGTIEIRNLGTEDLIITGIRGSRQKSVFATNLEIDTNKPLRLAPNQVFFYEVRFFPLDTKIYTDSMFFISNSEKNNVDSVGDLRGRGIKLDLFANSYDWGRKRIDRYEFPSGPYYPDITNQIIKIENEGTMAVTIYNIKIINDIKGNSFEFDRYLFKKMVIQPKDFTVVPVRFHPVDTGFHELIIEYDNTAGSSTQTILRGTGTVPQIEISDYDFGSTLLNDTSNPNTRIIRITNRSASDWPYGDSVTIFNLISLPNGNEISFDLVSWGSEGFRYDKSAISFPIKLAQGEYIEFPAQFVALKDSQSIALLKSVSDAEEEVTSQWSGLGIIDDVDDNSHSDNEIELYPNPADDFLTIYFNEDDVNPVLVRLFDYYGNVIYENKNIIENNLKIRTSEMSSGMYFIQIGDGLVRKVLVVH